MIDDIKRLFTRKEIINGMSTIHGNRSNSFFTKGRCMRRPDEVWQCKKWIVRRRRFRFKNVSGRGSDPSLLQSLIDSFFIPDGTAGNIQEYTAAFHMGNTLFI